MQSQAQRKTFIVIMAGGVGSRFWPASRESQPKQFLDILGIGKSLIQMTYERSLQLVSPNQIIVLTHEKYVAQVQKHLPDLPLDQIIAEPARRNTGPAVAFIALHIQARFPHSNILMLPADHLIMKEEKFVEALNFGIPYIEEKGGILTLGMTAHQPNTGYGYIELGSQTSAENIYTVQAFKEKPDLATAQQYLATGNFVWNAGIFLFKVEEIIELFRMLCPQVYSTLYDPKVYGTSKESDFISERYPQVESISIDYAILEKAEKIYCMPLEIGWSDLGTWKSLYEVQSEDSSATISNLSEENCYIEESKGVLLQLPPEKKAIVCGVENMLIVDTDDVLMIWPMDREQEIKHIKNKLAAQWKKG